MASVKERLTALRAGMREAGIDWYIVPSGDCHGSEYLSDYFRTMRFISGFTGSAGTVLIENVLGTGADVIATRTVESIG